MAYTEYYVTSAAGGSGDGSEGDPWTLAEALTNAVAGDRVNVQSDAGYSLGADTVTNAGTAVSLICFRGYNSSIGDLENQGWNSDGTLNVTNYPVITLSGTLTAAATSIECYVLFQNLSITGALSNVLVGNASADNWHMVECKVVNTQNQWQAGAVLADNNCSFTNCDFECSGAEHSIVLDADSNTRVSGCRFKGTETSQRILNFINASVVGCTFIGPGIGLSEQGSGMTMIVSNTFYNLERAIQLENAAVILLMIVQNNHVTDCAEYINNLYSGTANKAVIEVNNRTRDNTTPRTGIGDGANVGEVTTDTGDDTTDYEDASSGDFHLIDAAPGQGTGMRARDIGAYKATDPAGGPPGDLCKTLPLCGVG